MAMKPDIKAGSYLAAALAQHSNATAHTMLENSEMLGRNLSNIFDRMERNRQLKQQEEQQKLDNAYRENVFNEQKANNARSYDFEREKYNNEKHQWAQEYALKKETSNYDNALKKAQTDYYRDNKGKGDKSVDDLYMPDENMDYDEKEQVSQPQQQMLFLSREEADKARMQAQSTQTTPQQPAPQSYLSAQYAINQRNAQAKIPNAHPQAPNQQSFIRQSIPFEAIGNPVKIPQPQIIMQSNNPKRDEAEFNQKMAEADKMISQMQQKLNSLEAK